MSDEHTSTLEGWQEVVGIDPQTVDAPLPMTVAGEEALLFRTPGGFRGVQRVCPHQDKSLANAKIVSDGRMIRCLFHGYTFKLDDGKGVNCPGYAITIYEVREENGKLYARKRV